MKFDPRPYQQEASEALNQFVLSGQEGNPIVVVPTGGGKAFLVGKFMQDMRQAFPGCRMINVTHVGELVEQNFLEARELWPEIPSGLYSAGLGRKQAHCAITFASIQSIYKKAHLFKHIDFLIVDECQMMSNNAKSMYGKLITALRAVNPNLRVVGFTATAYRLDSGGLIGGEGAIFTDLVYDVRLGDLVRDGYLSPLRSKAPDVVYDLTGVKTSGGDFVMKDLDAAINTEKLNIAAVNEMIAAGKDRRSWLCFCVSVDHAYAVRDLVRANGISAEVVEGNIDKGLRKRHIARFKNEEIRCLISVNVLLIGFNAPKVDLIALMRSTKSTGLYVQTLGRGTRKAPGKDDCLVLDYGRNIERFGPVDLIPSMLPPKGQGSGEALVKECPCCHELVHIAIMECPDCGYEFPPPEKEEVRGASTKEVMATIGVDENDWLAVMGVMCFKHAPMDGRAPTLRIEYTTVRNGKEITAKDWICVGHTSSMGAMAERWWGKMGGQFPAPVAVDEAITRIGQGELTPPSAIKLKSKNGYWNVAEFSHSEQGVVCLTDTQLTEQGMTGAEMLKLFGKSGDARKFAEKHGISAIGKSGNTNYFSRDDIDQVVASMEDV